MGCVVVKDMSCFALECRLGRETTAEKHYRWGRAKMEVESTRSIEMESTKSPSTVSTEAMAGGSCFFHQVRRPEKTRHLRFVC